MLTEIVKFKVMVSTIKDVKEFINLTTAYPRNDVEIIATQGKYSVDAKSIMGVFSLDLSNPFYLSFESENILRENELLDMFYKWIILEGITT